MKGLTFKWGYSVRRFINIAKHHNSVHENYTKADRREKFYELYRKLKRG
jgi:hypothetical protein